MTGVSLRTRLFASYAGVVAVGAATVLTVTRLLVPRLFDPRMARFGLGSGRGRAAGAGEPDVHAALVAALNTALVAALVASLAIAAVAAALIARRVLRPLDDLRQATRRLAGGRYGDPVPLPSEPELAALARDVNELAATLAAVDSRRAALIGDVSHEMRTPLTTIGGFIEGLADGVFTTEEVVAAVSDELGRLQRLSADLALVSRADEGTPDLVQGDVDLAEVARAVADHLQPQYADKGVRLVVEGPAVVAVRGDRDRLMQAVTNLVGNALSYTPGGGSVTVTTGHDAKGRAQLVVTDTGRGLSPADTERIFERFFRVDGGRRTGGSGIGLTIARSIARGHGGDVVAASAGPGRGATFTLSLPARFSPGAGGPAAGPDGSV